MTQPANGNKTVTTPEAEAILTVWFGTPNTPTFGRKQKFWFTRNTTFDTTLRERFAASITAARNGDLDPWTQTPSGTLALIILLDQFSRNCHRGTPLAFAADEKALHLAQQITKTAADQQLPTAHHRAFAYLPFEHAESLAAQHESLRLFKQLQAEPEGATYYSSAVRHAKIIERFGRFPHRNAILGRQSTKEEEAFLLTPGSSF